MRIIVTLDVNFDRTRSFFPRLKKNLQKQASELTNFLFLRGVEVLLQTLYPIILINWIHFAGNSYRVVDNIYRSTGELCRTSTQDSTK